MKAPNQEPQGKLYNQAHDNHFISHDKPAVFAKPRRLPARSIKEIRRRRLGEAYQSPLERVFYAVLNALLYGFVGLLIDLAIVVICSLLNVGSGEVFWLFTPFLSLLGFIIGFVVGKNAGADSMDALAAEPESHLNHIDDYSVRHDVFRGLGTGIFIFAVIWLIMMLMI